MKIPPDLWNSVQRLANVAARRKEKSDRTGRVAWMSIATGVGNLVAVGIASCVGIVSGPKAATAVLAVTVPLATAIGVYVATMLWRRHLEQRRASEDLFDAELLAEDEYNHMVELIEQLNVGKAKKERLLVHAFENYQIQLVQIRARDLESVQPSATPTVVLESRSRTRRRKVAAIEDARKTDSGNLE